MSVFKVNLHQGSGRNKGGSLDDNTPSVQQTVYAMGPNRVNRKMTDGQTFTDCNYWKRYAYPQLPYNEAFIEVVTDDGSVYVDGQESTYPVVWNKTISAGSTYSSANNTFDILSDYGGHAKFTQISVLGHAVGVRFNGLSGTEITVEANTSQIFNSGDLTITKLQFDNSTSGTSSATVEVLTSVVVKCNS